MEENLTISMILGFIIAISPIIIIFILLSHSSKLSQIMIYLEGIAKMEDESLKIEKEQLEYIIANSAINQRIINELEKNNKKDTL